MDNEDEIELPEWDEASIQAKANTTASGFARDAHEHGFWLKALRGISQLRYHLLIENALNFAAPHSLWRRRVNYKGQDGIEVDWNFKALSKDRSHLIDVILIVIPYSGQQAEEKAGGWFEVQRGEYGRALAAGTYGSLEALFEFFLKYSDENAPFQLRRDLRRLPKLPPTVHGYRGQTCQSVAAHFSADSQLERSLREIGQLTLDEVTSTLRSLLSPEDRHCAVQHMPGGVKVCAGFQLREPGKWRLPVFLNIIPHYALSHHGWFEVLSSGKGVVAAGDYSDMQALFRYFLMVDTAHIDKDVSDDDNDS